MSKYYLAMPITEHGKKVLSIYRQSHVHPGGVEFAFENNTISGRAEGLATRDVDYTLTIEEDKDA